MPIDRFDFRIRRDDKEESPAPRFWPIMSTARYISYNGAGIKFVTWGALVPIIWFITLFVGLGILGTPRLADISDEDFAAMTEDEREYLVQQEGARFMVRTMAVFFLGLERSADDQEQWREFLELAAETPVSLPIDERFLQENPKTDDPDAFARELQMELNDLRIWIDDKVRELVASPDDLMMIEGRSYPKAHVLEDLERMRYLLRRGASPPVANPLMQRLNQEPTTLQPLFFNIGFTHIFVIQSWIVVVLVGLIAAPLIAKDRSTKAPLVYFARPVRFWDYLLGKLGAGMSFVAWALLVPGLLALLVVAFLVTVDGAVLTVLLLFGKLLLATLVFGIPLVLFALAIGSLFTSPRLAQTAFFGAIIIAEIGFNALRSDSRDPSGWLCLISPLHSAKAAVTYIFGAPRELEALNVANTNPQLLETLTEGYNPIAAVIGVAAVTLVSLWMIRGAINREIRK